MHTYSTRWSKWIIPLLAFPLCPYSYLVVSRLPSILIEIYWNLESIPWIRSWKTRMSTSPPGVIAGRACYARMQAIQFELPPPLLKHLRYDLEPDNGRLLRNETCTQSREQQPFQSFRINWHVRASSGGRKLLFKTLEIHFFFRILIFWIERWTRVIDFVRLIHPRWNAFANNTFCRKFWCMTSKTISANCN